MQTAASVVAMSLRAIERFYYFFQGTKNEISKGSVCVKPAMFGY